MERNSLVAAGSHVVSAIQQKAVAGGPVPGNTEGSSRQTRPLLDIVSVRRDQSQSQKVSIDSYRKRTELISGNDSADRGADGFIGHRRRFYFCHNRLIGGSGRLLFQRRQDDTLVAHVDRNPGTYINFLAGLAGTEFVIFSGRHFRESVGSVRARGSVAGKSNGRIFERNINPGKRIAIHIIDRAVHNCILSSGKSHG